MRKKILIAAEITISLAAIIALYITLFPNTGNPQIGTAILLASYLGILSSIAVILFLKWKTLTRTWKEKTATAILLSATLYLTIPGIINLTSWYQKTPTKLATQTIKESATPAQADAGKAYLKAIQEPTDAIAFQKAMTPLLQEERWVFPKDDPNLYQVRGVIGGHGKTWEYMVPIGNVKENSTALLELAETDLKENRRETATEKIGTVLGVGNRVSDHPQLITWFIGENLVSQTIKLIQENPELAKDPNIQKELVRAKELGQKQAIAMEQEFLSTDKYLEELTLPNGNPGPIGATVHAKYWKGVYHAWKKTGQEENPNWGTFLRNQKRKALLTGNHTPLVSIAIPAYPGKTQIPGVIEQILE